MSVGVEMPHEAYQRNLYRQSRHQAMSFVAPGFACNSAQGWPQQFGHRQQRPEAFGHDVHPAHYHRQQHHSAHHPQATLIPVVATVPNWNPYGQPLFETGLQSQSLPAFEPGHPFHQVFPYHLAQLAGSTFRPPPQSTNFAWSAVRHAELPPKHIVPAQIPAPVRAENARRQAPTYAEYDHPSHYNPPHRITDAKKATSKSSSAVQIESAAAHSVSPLLAAFNDNCTTGDLQTTEYQLIPLNATVVPPHPPVEKSGVPFASFAADFIWEVCVDAREQADAAAASRVDESGMVTPNIKPIGGERMRHNKVSSHSSLQSVIGSTEVSPTSSVGPITPVSSVRTLNDVFHVRRFSFGKTEIIDCFSTPPPAKLFSIWNDDAVWPERNAEADRSRSGSRGRPALQAPAEFKDYVINLLTVTLVTPQVLLLALHYAKAIPFDVLTETYPVDLAPYRLLLGCLIVANKHLDDNSFRCSTWAQVSTLGIKEVVAAETFVFKAFNFEINVDGSVWLDFMHALTERRARTNPSPDDPVLGRLLNLVDTAVAWPF